MMNTSLESETKLAHIDDYLHEHRNDFYDYYCDEEIFFKQWGIPEDQWEAYRWERGRSAREALAEKEKRAAEAMTVGQLIERLKEFPADMPACVRSHWSLVGVNKLSIEKDLQPNYNSYYKGQVTFKCEKKVEVLLIEGLS